MLSDELKEALDYYRKTYGGSAPTFAYTVKEAIPRIVALERENKALKKQIDLHIELEATHEP